MPSLLITPPARQSSSAPACPPHPQPRRACGRDPRLATSRWNVTARPPLGFHEWEVAGEGRIYRHGRRGGSGRGPGAELTRPQSLLVPGLGPDWLAAGGKRDLGQTGWYPPIKNRFRMDSRGSQSKLGRGRVLPAPPLSFVLCAGGGAPGRRRVRSDGSGEPVPRARSRSQRPSAGARPPVPAALAPLWPLRGQRAGRVDPASRV